MYIVITLCLLTFLLNMLTTVRHICGIWNRVIRIGGDKGRSQWRLWWWCHSKKQLGTIWAFGYCWWNTFWTYPYLFPSLQFKWWHLFLCWWKKVCLFSLMTCFFLPRYLFRRKCLNSLRFDSYAFGLAFLLWFFDFFAYVQLFKILFFFQCTLWLFWIEMIIKKRVNDDMCYLIW